jgi:hypothetical protein
VQRGSEAKTYSAVPGGYTTSGKLSTSNIPVLPTGTAGSWTGNTNHNIKVGYDTQNGITGTTFTSYNLYQKQYSLSITSASASINYVTLGISTDAPNYSLKLMVGSTQIGSTGTVSGSSVGVQLGQLNTTGSQRMVDVYNVTSNTRIGGFYQPVAYTYLIRYIGSTIYGNGTDGVTNHGCPGGYSVYYPQNTNMDGVGNGDGSVVNAGDYYVVNHCTNNLAAIHLFRTSGSTLIHVEPMSAQGCAWGREYSMYNIYVACKRN